MAIVSALLLVLAVLGGAVLGWRRLRAEQTPPLPLAIGHGALAAVGLVGYLVVLAGATDPPATGVWGAGVLVVAALGGLTMLLGFHLRGRELPLPLVLGHGALGIVGTGLIVLAVTAATGDAPAAPAY